MTNRIDNGKPLMNEGRVLFYPQSGSSANRHRAGIQPILQVRPPDHAMRRCSQAPTSISFTRTCQPSYDRRIVAFTNSLMHVQHGLAAVFTLLVALKYCFIEALIT
jgi:hypothetical protein